MEKRKIGKFTLVVIETYNNKLWLLKLIKVSVILAQKRQDEGWNKTEYKWTHAYEDIGCNNKGGHQSTKRDTFQ